MTDTVQFFGWAYPILGKERKAGKEKYAKVGASNKHAFKISASSLVSLLRRTAGYFRATSTCAGFCPQAQRTSLILCDAELPLAIAEIDLTPGSTASSKG